jgi:hypothetical protein
MVNTPNWLRPGKSESSIARQPSAVVATHSRRVGHNCRKVPVYGFSVAAVAEQIGWIIQRLPQQGHAESQRNQIHPAENQVYRRRAGQQSRQHRQRAEPDHVRAER